MSRRLLKELRDVMRNRHDSIRCEAKSRREGLRLSARCGGDFRCDG
jgi:hypothetical protein